MPGNGKSMRARRSRAGKKKGQNGAPGDRTITQDVGLVGRNILAPSAVSLRAFGLPAEWRMKLRYVESVSVVAATGALGIYQWRTNSLFDPNFTGTGHQPYGFDQMKTYYNSYLVTGSKISAECLSSATVVCLAGVATSAESSTGVTTADGYMEPGKGQGGLLYSNSTRGFESKWALSSIADHDPADYSALISASPANSDFYTVFVQDAYALAGTATLFVTVCIEYDCVFKDPATFATS
jgi:hypothetical protein